MINMMIVVNVLAVLGMIISAVIAISTENMLSSVIALGVMGLFAAAAFLFLMAPDVAISEAAVGAGLSPLVFIIALRKINKGGKDK